MPRHPIYALYHSLSKLETTTEYLDPMEEYYLYSTNREDALDTTKEIALSRKIHKKLRREYEDLLNQEFDLTDQDLPIKHSIQIKAANLLYYFSFIIHHDFSQALVLLNNQVLDHRSVGSFPFSSRKNLRALPSLKEQAHFSQKGRAIIQILQKTLRREIEEVRETVIEVVEQSFLAEEGQEDELLKAVNEGNIEVGLLNHQISKLTDSIYATLEFANDHIKKSKNNESVSSLILAAADLGTGLKSCLRAVEKYKQLTERSLSNFEQEIVLEGTIISNPIQDLNTILGVNAHNLMRTMFKKERGINNSNAYSIYKQSLIVNYALATATIMANVPHTPEGRNSFRNRLKQELKYFSSQAQRKIIHKDRSQAKGNALTFQSDKDIEKTRDHFLSKEVVSNREEIEAQLWQAFFDHAEISPEEFSKRVLTISGGAKI